MHLAVDAVGVKHGGGATVLTDLLQAAIDDTRFERVTVFCSPRKTRMVEIAASEKIIECEQAVAESGAISRLLWSQRYLAREVVRKGADALLSFTGIGVGPPSAPTVSFIQQSLPFCPEALRTCSLGVRLRMTVIRRAMQRSCRSSSLTIVQTPTMKRWVTSRLLLPESRVQPVIPCVREFARGEVRTQRWALLDSVPDDRRLLYVGSTASYKNLISAAQAAPIVRKLFPGTVLFLTCPPDHPLCSHEGVVGIGYIGADELQRVYSMVTLFVMPSLVESGNLTMMEAMAADTPVLAPDRPYAHDLCEDAALFFDPLSPSDLAAKAIALLKDEPARSDLVRRGNCLISRRRLEKPYERILDAIWQIVERRSTTLAVQTATTLRHQQGRS